MDNNTLYLISFTFNIFILDYVKSNLCSNCSALERRCFGENPPH